MGATLRALAPDLWVADRPLRIVGIEIGCRMTVARLGGGRLFVHSPVALDPPTRAALDGLGALSFVVAPSKVHHFFVADYLGAYPEARVYAAPGLAEKRRDLAFHAVLGDRAEAGWAAAIDQLLFEGMPQVNEVVFFHRRSRTLILTDLAFNVRRDVPFAARIFFRLNGALGRFGPTRLVRLLVRDRAAARRSTERILEWDFDRVILAHGDVLESGGREALRAAWSWL